MGRAPEGSREGRVPVGTRDREFTEKGAAWRGRRLQTPGRAGSAEDDRPAAPLQQAVTGRVPLTLAAEREEALRPVSVTARQTSTVGAEDGEACRSQV